MSNNDFGNMLPGASSAQTTHVGADTDAIHKNVAAEITAVTEKTTSTANDELLIEDSAAANVKKSMKLSAMAAGVHGSGTDNTLITWNGTTGQLDDSPLSESSGSIVLAGTDETFGFGTGTTAPTIRFLDSQKSVVVYGGAGGGSINMGSSDKVSLNAMELTSTADGFDFNSTLAAGATFGFGGDTAKATVNADTLTTTRVQALSDNAGSIPVSSGTTGGSASAGAGNQYIELTIGTTTYKLLHDGTV